MINEKSILIVDDDGIVRGTTAAMLEGNDYQIYFAASGPEALIRAAEILPDVILLDVMMPGMNGFEACQALRADPRLADVPILLVTSLEDHASKLRGLEAGADDFLTKPIDRLELRTRVKAIIRLNRYRRMMEERANFAAALEAKNRQLSELSQRLVDLQEAERRFIAAELHDDIGQMLTGLKLTIEMAESQNQDDQQVTLSRAKGLITELSSRVRNLSLDLRPAMLDDFGLFAALEWLFDRYTQQTHIRVRHNFSYLDERRFPKPVETAAFRIIQEALTNAARHAQVSEVEVNILAGAQQLEVEVRDRGKGFNTAQLLNAAYHSGGLSGMRERVNWLSGELSIESADGAGTTIRATFKLEA